MNRPNFFFGVWAQPTASYAKWKSMGINLIFPDTTENISPAARRKACADLGLYYVDTLTDINDIAPLSDPYCVAIYPNDEPSNDAPFFNQAGYLAYINAWKARWNPILQIAKGKKPIYINFAGGHVIAARPWTSITLDPNQPLNQIQAFCDLADIISCDLYPWDPFDIWTGWQNGTQLPVSLADPSKPDPLALGCTIQGYATRLLKQFCPGKQVWGFIQADQFDNAAGARGPTAAEMQAQVDGLLKEGVTSIVAFVDNLMGPNGWADAGLPAGQTNWDGETTEEAAQLKKMALQLTGGTPPVIVPTPPVILPSTDLTALTNRVTALEQGLANLKANAVVDVSVKRLS